MSFLEQKVNPFLYPGLARPLDKYVLRVIIHTVLNFYGFTVKEFNNRAKSNSRKYSKPRWLIWYFAKKYTKYTNAQLGFKLGHKASCTVSNAVTTLNFFYDTYKEDREIIDALDKQIRNGIFNNNEHGKDI